MYLKRSFLLRCNGNADCRLIGGPRVEIFIKNIPEILVGIFVLPCLCMVSWGPSSKRSLCQHLLAASNFRSSLAFSFPPLLGETAFHPTPTLLCSCWFLLLSCVSSSQSSQTTPLLFVLCYVRETAHAFCSLLKSHRTSSSGKARQAPVQHKPWPNPAHQIATTGSASGLSAGKYPRSKLEAWLLFSVIKLAFFFFSFFLSSLTIIVIFSDVCYLCESLRNSG